MNHASLFSGIGGFDLAAEWADIENVFNVELNAFCDKVLRKNFPDVMRYYDIKEFRAKEYKGAIDILSGGFPCQPFSIAGKRAGKEDDRYLWPEMLRIIQEIEPTWIIGENVPGIVNMELDEVLADLESENYETQSFNIPACGVNAWHRRYRIWIIAYNEKSRIRRLSIQQRTEREESPDFDGKIEVGINPNNDSKRLQKQCIKKPDETKHNSFKLLRETFSDTQKTMCKQSGNSREWRKRPANSNWWAVEPELGRMADGIPYRVDRLKALGNAIVPQVAYEIFKMIKCCI